MKWLLLAILVFIVVSGRGRLGELVGATKRLPRDYDDGKKRVDDPAMAAKDITPSKDSSPHS